MHGLLGEQKYASFIRTWSDDIISHIHSPMVKVPSSIYPRLYLLLHLYKIKTNEKVNM